MKTKNLGVLVGMTVLSLVLFFGIRTFAVSNAVTVSNLVTTSTTVKENALLPVFKIAFGNVESAETLTRVDVILNSSATADPSAITSDVLEDNRVYDGGWQLWKDSSSGTAGTFERFTDQQVLLASNSLNYGTSGAFSITPDTAQSLSNSDVYYVVIKTDDSNLPNSSLSFSVSLKANGIVTSGATQPTNSLTTSGSLTLSSTPKLVRAELLDGGLSQGNRIKFVFNQQMDFSSLSTYGLSNTYYIYGYDSSWLSLSWGSGATVAFSNDGGATNDTVTITLGSSPTITTSSYLYYSIPNATSSWWSWGTITLDNTRPTLTKAQLITDVGSDGKATAVGDQIALQFSEAINILSNDGDSGTPAITPSNINTVLPLSGGASWDNSGTKPILTSWGSSVLVVTLRNTLATDLVGKTVDPASTVEDMAGNTDNTTTAPTIGTTTLPPPSSVTLRDCDTANSWIDKQDICVDYVLPSYASSVTSDTDFHADVYLLPEDVGLDTSRMFRINHANLTTSTASSTLTFRGANSDYSLYYDSRMNYPKLAANDYSTPLDWQGINSGVKYVAYVVVSTDSHSTEGAAGTSIVKPSEPLEFTAESYSDITTPYVSSYSPNSSSVATNTTSFSMTFTEALDETAAGTLSNYALKYDSDGNWTYDAETALSSVSYDKETYTVTVKTTTSLKASAWYYLQPKSDVKDLYGTSVGSYAGFYFQTGSAADTTPPTVKSISIGSTTLYSSTTTATTATGVSPSSGTITAIFSESMGPSTITSTSATIDPAVAGTSVEYDSSAYSLKFNFGNVNMAENTTYTFTLAGSTITDAAGNKLDGNGNGTASGTSTDNKSVSFTTGSLDTVAPKISWSTFDGYTVKVGFDKSMKESDVEDDSNWTLTCTSSGSTTASTQSLTWATFSYDDYTSELSISGLYCSDASSYTLTAASGMRGGNNKTIDSTAKSSTGTVKSQTVTTGSYGDTTSTYYSYYSPISVSPSDNTAGATTDYYISLPLTSALSDGYKIIIEWPAGTDASSASVKSITGTRPSWSNGDINGSWTGLYDRSGGTLYPEGVVKLFDTASSSSCPSSTSCIQYDSVLNQTTLTVWLDYNDDGTRDSTAVTGSTDYIYFDLSGVKNPTTAATVDWYTNTGGYTARVSTETDKGAPVQSAQKSYAFSISAAGTGTLTCSTKADSSTGTGISGAYCSAWGGSNYTSRSCTTGSDGTCTITGAQDGSWYFWVEPPSGGRYTTDYSSSSSTSSCTISSTSTSCTYTGILKSLNTSVSGTITHPTSLANKVISIWQYGKDDYSWSNTDVTLESDGSTDYTIYTTTGKKEIGIYEKMYSNDFASPPSKTVNVTANMTGINFSLTVPDKSVCLKALDSNGSGLASVSVGLYCYDSDCGYGSWGSTGSDGKVTLKVVPGDYNAYAYQSGFGNQEKSVTVASNGTVTPVGSSGCLEFKFVQADSTVSGTVVDDQGSAIQYASVSYRDSEGNSQWASTNNQGDYLIYVPGGTGVTGSVTVYSWQHGGDLPCASGVTCTNFSVAASSTKTGINFKYDASQYSTISGSVKANGSGVQWASIWAEVVDKTTGKQTGSSYGSWASTDANGNYSIKVTKNTSTTCYNVSAWTSGHGELPTISCLDVSSGNLTGKNWDLGTLRTITVSVSGAGSVSKASLDLRQQSVEGGIWKDIDLASGSGTASFDISEGTYTASLNLDGFRNFSPDSPDGSGFTVSGANKTLTFTLSSSLASALTVSGQVVNSSGTAIDGARVTFFNETTGSEASVTTGTAGTYSVTLESGTYKGVATKSNYASSDQITLTASSSSTNFTLKASDASISGTVYNANGTKADDAFIVATTSDQWVMTRTENGTYTLPVLNDASEDWDVEVMTKNGYRDIVQDVPENTTGLTLTASTQMVTDLADLESTASLESQPFSLDDEANGCEIKFPNKSYNDSVSDTAAGTLTVEEVAITSSASKSVDVIDGKAKEIILTDSGGQVVSNLTANADITFEYTKTEIDAAVTAGTMEYKEWKEEPDIAYLEESTQAWVTMPTTCEAQVKTSSTSSFTDADCSTVATNITNNKDTYADYKFELHTVTDHLTVFGVVTPTDITAPAAPTGLTATTGSSRVTLDWNDNSESDILEYAVYRSTSTTVSLAPSNQINTSQVTSSAYTDTTVTNGTKYYYIVTAIDKSGNASTASNTASATPTATADTTAPAAPTGLGASAGDARVTLDWSDNSESDLAKYNVYRSTSSSVSVSSGNRLNTTNVTASTYVDSTASNGTKYYYVVTALDTSGNESNATNTVNATPQAAATTSTSSSSSGGGSGGSSGSSSSSSKTTKSTTPGGSPEEDVTVHAAAEEPEEELIPLPFIDTVGHWAESYIQSLYSRGVVSGYSETSFGPDNNLTRAEFSKILINLYGISAPPVIESPFKDVDAEAWYAGYVAQMKEMGVIQGYSDGTFKPDQAINRSEALKMIFVIAGKSVDDVDVSENPFTDVDVTAWYAPYVLSAYKLGIVSGYRDADGNLTGLFGPGNTVTRGEIAKIATLIL